MATYRELEVDVHFADRRVDLIDEGYDLAIRIGPLVDSTLIARPLATSEFYVCASPRYIEAHGEPQSPEELGLHECLSYAYQATGSNWQLHSDGKEQTIPVRGGRLSTNNGDCLLGAVRAGLGLSLLPDFFVADDLRTGALRRVLAPWRQQSLVCAVYPHNRHLSTKIRTFVGFLADRWRIPPWAQCRAPSALQAGMGA
jgi:DNA-binding transcriptional LysR family regulator